MHKMQHINIRQNTHTQKRNMFLELDVVILGVKEWGCINTTRSNKNSYSQSLDNVCQQASGLLAQNLFHLHAKG